MKPLGLVALMKRGNPEALKKIPDPKLARIVRVAFNQLGRQLDAASEGIVRVPGFGIFRMRRVEREKDGKKITLKRIMFRRAKAALGGRRRAAKQHGPR